MGVSVWGAAEANTDVFVLHARAVRMYVMSVRRTAACAALFRKLICHEQAGAIIGMTWGVATPQQLTSKVAALVSVALLERGTWERPGLVGLCWAGLGGREVVWGGPVVFLEWSGGGQEVVLGCVQVP